MKKLNIFILMGQSNMSGRGDLSEVPALRHPDVFMWRHGQWMAAEEPLHTDKPQMVGVGLGMRFAIEVMNRTGLSPIGLVPCAVGGSPLRRWMPGEDLYEGALKESVDALQYGNLAGFLWHQGEHDACGAEMAATYAERLAAMITCLRTALGRADAPFMAGEIGHFLKDFEKTTHYELINRTLRDLGKHVPGYLCVSADGLTDKGDSLHFNAASLREFGIRYARAFEQMARQNTSARTV